MNSFANSIVCNDLSLSNTISVDYLAGFMLGFTDNDHKTELKTCFTATPDFQTNLCKSVAGLNIKSGLVVNEVIKMITQDLSELESFTGSCPENVKNDLAKIMNWWQYWQE